MAKPCFRNDNAFKKLGHFSSGLFLAKPDILLFEGEYFCFLWFCTIPGSFLIASKKQEPQSDRLVQRFRFPINTASWIADVVLNSETGMQIFQQNSTSGSVITRT